MPKIGMLYLCTGKYTVFWPEFYHSFEANFLPGCDKEYFVFTDADHIEGEENPRVHRLCQEAYDWPTARCGGFPSFCGGRNCWPGAIFSSSSTPTWSARRPSRRRNFCPGPRWGKTCCWWQQPDSGTKNPSFTPTTATPKAPPTSPTTAAKTMCRAGSTAARRRPFCSSAMSWPAAPRTTWLGGVIARWHDESQLNRLCGGAQRLPAADPRLLVPRGVGPALRGEDRGAGQGPLF